MRSEQQGLKGVRVRAWDSATTARGAPGFRAYDSKPAARGARNSGDRSLSLSLQGPGLVTAHLQDIGHATVGTGP